MPEIDGISFYERIYDRGERKVKYPVLVLTARANLGALFAKLDVDGFMTKPFEIDDFLREVEMIMHKRYGMPCPVIPEIREEPKKKTPKKVLVIEDDQKTFNEIVLTFANRGYDLSAAKTGY